MAVFNPQSHHYGPPCKRGHDGMRFNANNSCVECTKVRTLAAYAEDKTAWNERNLKWHKENRERSNAIRNRYLEKNPALTANLNANRRAAVIQAIPMWADLNLILEIYKNCPAGMTVDHIVPLQSKLVCGLHVGCNLQYLSGSENSEKGNRWWPDMPE